MNNLVFRQLTDIFESVLYVFGQTLVNLLILVNELNSSPGLSFFKTVVVFVALKSTDVLYLGLRLGGYEIASASASFEFVSFLSQVLELLILLRFERLTG